jgi:uncharacterized protein (UPF0548 family)
MRYGDSVLLILLTILPRRLASAEGAMKRQWNIRRQTTAVPDGQQRWDQAYQMLMEWTRCTTATETPPEQEKHDASRRVCTSIDHESGPPANH